MRVHELQLFLLRPLRFANGGVDVVVPPTGNSKGLPFPAHFGVHVLYIQVFVHGFCDVSPLLVSKLVHQLG